jgi:hypothetical protein
MVGTPGKGDPLPDDHLTSQNRRLPDGGDQDKKQRPSSCEFLFVLGFFICRLKHQTTTMLEIWFFACVSQNKGL